MKSETKKVTFVIQGEYIAYVARDLMLDGRWEYAFKLLYDNLEGITHEQAISLLNGDTTLIGDSNTDIDLVPWTDIPDCNKYKHNLASAYAGICKLANSNADICKLSNSNLSYRPYAHILAYTSVDIKGPPLWVSRGITLRPAARNNRDCSYYRAMFYANNPITDRAYVITNKQLESMGVVLFEVCHSRPFWMNELSNAASAVEEYIKYHTLHAIEPEQFVQDDNSSIIPACMVNNNDYEDIIPEHIKKGISAYISGEQDFESDVIVDSEFRNKSGYILTDGTFYGCEYHEHKALATRIFQHVFKTAIKEDDDIEQLADNKHMVRIQQSALGDIAISCSETAKLTQSQIDTLFGFVQKHCIMSNAFANLIDNNITYVILDAKQ